MGFKTNHESVLVSYLIFIDSFYFKIFSNNLVMAIIFKIVAISIISNRRS